MANNTPEPLFQSEPDYVNPEGTKWWKSESLSNEAERELGKNYRVYAAQTVEDNRSYILIDDSDEVLDMDSSMEGMAIKIAKHMMLRRGY